MTFYLKYRPQKLEELDLTSVRESLIKVVKSGSVPHAFLFAGPKGTGKTSTARILAKIVNCEKQVTGNKSQVTSYKEPCNKCEQCVSITKGTNIDVIELDAASNRGIDDVRALREAVKLAPAKAKKKVYIIDEAHMLTTEASNALLKTLEEPPSHVMFILATTNPEKLIETIRSRTTFIPFTKATVEELSRSLERVVRGEKIKIKKDALEVIAKATDGSFRDAVKILEQLVTENKNLEKDKIEEHLFQKKIFKVDEFLEILSKKDVKAGIGEIERVLVSGGAMEVMIAEVLKRLREGLLVEVGAIINRESPEVSKFSKEDLLYLIELFGNASRELSDSPIEQLPVEIAVVKWCERSKVENGGSKLDIEDKSLKVEDKKPISENESQASNIKPQDPTSNFYSPASSIADEVWQKILAHVKPVNATIEALLRAAKPVGYDGKVLTLGVFYRFHKERLEEINQRRILEDVVTSVLGSPSKITCVLTEPPPRKIEIMETNTTTVLTEGKDKDIIEIAEEIFGN